MGNVCVSTQPVELQVRTIKESFHVKLEFIKNKSVEIYRNFLIELLKQSDVIVGKWERPVTIFTLNDSAYYRMLMFFHLPVPWSSDRLWLGFVYGWLCRKINFCFLPLGFGTRSIRCCQLLTSALCLHLPAIIQPFVSAPLSTCIPGVSQYKPKVLQ